MEKEKRKIPEIRFPGFTDDWEQRKSHEIFQTITDYVANGSFASLRENVSYSKKKDFAIVVRLTDYSNKYKGPFLYTSELGYKFLKKSSLVKGDILISNVGANAGLVYRAPNMDVPMTLGPNSILVRSDGNDTEFLYQMMKTTYGEKKIKEQIGISAQPKFNKTEFRQIDFFLPSNDEQKQIGTMFSQLDKTIALHQSKLEVLKNSKQTLLQKMFPQTGENVPEIRFPGFTEAWEQSQLGHIADIYDGTHQTPKYTDSGIKFVSVENISNLETEKYISKEAYEKEYTKKQAQKGDVLMTRIGDIGTARVIETNEPLAYYVTLALLKPKIIESNFLSYLISSSEVQRNIWKRTLHIAFPKKINLGEINQVEVMTPKIEEQKLIGLLFKQLDDTIGFHQQELEFLKQQKQTLLNKLFV